jgi:sugar lactone lactonase YvrE
MSYMKKIALTLSLVTALSGASSAFAAGTDAIVRGENGQWLTHVELLAGTGELGFDDGAAAVSTFRTPNRLLAMPDGSVLISDQKNHLIRQWNGKDIQTHSGVVLEQDSLGHAIGALIDGKAGESLFQLPEGIAVDQQGNVYVADAGNHAIRKIDKNGQVSTLAGNGVIGINDGKGKAASFYYPTDVVVTADGTLYVADTLNHAIRKVTADGMVTTISGVSQRIVSPFPEIKDYAGDFKDGKLSEALFNEPTGLELDARGNLYVSDKGNQRIRYIDFAKGEVTTVAGSAQHSSSRMYEENGLFAPGGFADGKASEALFNHPKGIALTEEGGLLIADSMNHSIRYLQDGQVTTVAGDSSQYSGKSNGIDRYARLQAPSDVAVLADGTIMVADAYNNTLRQIVPYRLPISLAEEEGLKVFHGEERIEFDTEPEISNGRTMVPVRAITEALGFEVEFNDEAMSLQLIQGNEAIELYIGKPGMTKLVDAQAVKETTIDAAPYIKNDRTYVPLRFFSEELGLDVQWIGDYRAVIVRAK